MFYHIKTTKERVNSMILVMTEDQKAILASFAEFFDPKNPVSMLLHDKFVRQHFFITVFGNAIKVSDGDEVSFSFSYMDQNLFEELCGESIDAFHSFINQLDKDDEDLDEYNSRMDLMKDFSRDLMSSEEFNVSADYFLN